MGTYYWVHIMEFKPDSYYEAKPVTPARERLLFFSQCTFKHAGTQNPRLMIHSLLAY